MLDLPDQYIPSLPNLTDLKWLRMIYDVGHLNKYFNFQMGKMFSSSSNIKGGDNPITCCL